MNAYAQIEAAYAANPREETFDNYVRHFHRHGFVFSRPDFFVMGRPVARHAPEDMILDPRERFEGIAKDCWHLFAAAGNMARMWQVVPWELPFFCWSRLSDPLSGLRFVSTETLKRLCPPDLSALSHDSSPLVPPR